MEQRDDRTSNQNSDDHSSNPEIDLEVQDDEVNKRVNQEPPSDQLVLTHLFEVGEFVDFLQTHNHKWITMKIIDIQNHSLRLQHPDTLNTFWAQFDYDTIRKQWIIGTPLTCSRVDIRHPNLGWLEGVVLHTEKDKAFVHHAGYKKIYDMLYSQKDIAPLGFHTNNHGVGKLLRQFPQHQLRYQHRFNLYTQIRNLWQARMKYKEMEVSLQAVLQESNMCIKDVQGDGNCMFRAISDQLYGNEMYHKELRRFAMQYILSEKDYFQDYIINGNVEEYVEYKSKDGIWGDNIELQAFRELYDIPIEIYVCSKEPLKTGLEHNPLNKEPIRLSYHGRSHYNSIKVKDKLHNALLGNAEVGEYEKKMFEKVQIQNQMNKQMHQAARAQFENSISNELDIIFNESKRIFQEQEQKNEQKAIKESLLEQEYEEDEEQLMDMVIKESFQEIEKQEIKLVETQQQQPQVQLQQQQQPQQQGQNQQSIESQIIKKVMEQSEQEQEKQFMQQYEETQFQTALKESEKNIYEDPLSNPVIAQVMALGFFSLEQILEGYAIHRDDPEMIINYLFENFQ